MKKTYFSLVIIAAALTTAYSQKTAKTAAVGDGTFFSITIEHNGEKVELQSTQYEGYWGIASTDDSSHGKMRLQARAGNEKKNDDRYEFVGSIANDAKGSFEFRKDDGTNPPSFTTTKFPTISPFVCQTGAYDITAMPLKGGFVQGTFTANCEAPSPDGDRLDHYSLTGSFKLLRH